MTRVLVRCGDQKMIFNRAERSRLHVATQTVLFPSGQSFDFYEHFWAI